VSAAATGARPGADRRASETDPRMRARKLAVQREAGRRRLRIVAVVLVLVALVVTGLVLVHSSLFAARSIDIAGAVHEPRAEVLRVTGLAAHPPLIDVNGAAAASSLERLPWVLSAQVSRSWPSGVAVRIVERRPLAYVPLGGHRNAVVDGTGRVLEDVAAPPSGLVALAGVGAVPVPGGDLGAGDAPLLGLARALPGSIAGRVASIDSSTTDGVVVRLLHGPLVVLGSTAELHQKIVSLATVLARVSLAGIVTIDLRVPASPVLTP